MSSTVDRLTGHYHRMFSFPGVVVLLGGNLAVALVVAVLVFFLTSNLYVFITLLAVIILSQLLSSEITFRIASERTLLSRRRSLGLTLASSALMLLGFVIASATLIPLQAIGSIPYAMVVISASLGVYLRYFATFMYMQISRLRLLTAALSQPAILLIGSGLLFEQISSQSIRIIAGITVALILAELTIHVIKHRLSDFQDIDAVNLSRSFFAAWMGNNPERLEAALESRSVRSDLEVEAFAVKRAGGDRGMKTLLLAPRIHAGPFRNVGSSNLPAILSEKIDAEFKVPTFVFHGAVSHEHDLVHSGDTYRVAEALVGRLRQPYEEFHHGAMIIRTFDQMVGGVRFDRHLLLWVSLAPLLSEDLPYKLQQGTETYSGGQGMDRASLIDTHSCLSPTQPTEEDLKVLERQIRNLVDKLAARQRSELQLGVARIDAEGFSSEEIAGSGGIAAFLKTGSESQGVLLFDSNNMTLELRQFLDSELPKLLDSPLEVFTTDTHILVGIRSKKDYSPLGEKTENRLVLERSLDALRRARSDLEPVTVSPITVTIRDLPILGANTIETMGRAADVIVSLARRLLPITLIGCGFLTGFLLLVPW